MIVARSPLDLVVLLHPATEKSWFRVTLNMSGVPWRLCPPCAKAMYCRLSDTMRDPTRVTYPPKIEHEYNPVTTCDGCLSLEGRATLKHAFLKGWMPKCED